jgi:hypothetical protein
MCPEFDALSRLQSSVSDPDFLLNPDVNEKCTFKNKQKGLFCHLDFLKVTDEKSRILIQIR